MGKVSQLVSCKRTKFEFREFGIGRIRITKFNYPIFRDGLRPARAVIFRSESRSCNGLGVGTPRPQRGLSRPAEKLGDLRNPGLQTTPSRKQPLVLLFVTAPPQGGQKISERRFFLL